MPKSDKTRKASPHVLTINAGKPYHAMAQRPEAPLLGEGQGDSGKTPSTTHSKNLPMTNNKRAGFKSSCIFDK